jgi:serine/threonine protein kinase
MAKHGRYKIVRKVADGGMAEIFLATQIGREGFQKPVILKRIHSTIYADPQFRNMFIDEAHISMSLSHSNIVQVLDLGLGGGRYFLVMELVDGWDLGRIEHRAAAANMPLLPELGLHMTAEVCRALAYAHGKTHLGNPLGIVHRDVSPHNVLVSEQGEVKLTDFGIAKAMNKREQTGTGVVKGKVSFMSPEQALGKLIDARSDLFSLGTLLYQMMTGVRPFEAPTDLEILLRVQKAEFRAASQIKPDIEPELDQIMNRAMRFDPADRYQSADEMLADIERVLRTVFQPVGQTELKRWLADLQREDGVASIGKAAAGLPTTRAGTGELEGKDVVLSEPQEEELDVGGEDNTSLAVLTRPEADGRPRLSRHRATELPLPVPIDDESGLSDGRSESEMALPIPEDSYGPPGRRPRRRAGRIFSILFVGVLLIVGAAVAGSYLGSRAEEDRGAAPATQRPAPSTSASASAGAPSAAARAQTVAPAAVDRKREPAEAPSLAAAPREPAPPAAVEPHAAASREPPPSHEPTTPREPPPKKEKERARGGTAERPEYRGRGIIELKNMMQPDPSLLPPPPVTAPVTAPPPAAPPPSPPSKPTEPEAPPAAAPSAPSPPANP